MPDSAGLYAFVLERDGESTRVAYVGLTALPGHHARPGQRYGRPKYAGVTRERINALITQVVSEGCTVSQWVCPLDADALYLAEKDLIREWDLASLGWNLR